MQCLVTPLGVQNIVRRKKTESRELSGLRRESGAGRESDKTRVSSHSPAVHTHRDAVMQANRNGRAHPTLTARSNTKSSTSELENQPGEGDRMRLFGP